jgi:hypothetical protein
MNGRQEIDMVKVDGEQERETGIPTWYSQAAHSTLEKLVETTDKKKKRTRLLCISYLTP